MQAKIYCKTESKGKQTFYVSLRDREYFLFEQDFRRSNKDFFKNGYYLTDNVDYSKVRSTSVRKTLEKLPSYVKYVESEYGIVVYEKTKLKEKPQKIKTKHKRTPFLWQKYEWDIA